MAVEQRRGCGFRKVGGLYLVGSGSGIPCGRMPIPLSICPTCGHGIKQTRGWTWIDVEPLVKNLTCKASAEHCGRCPLSTPEKIGRAGLLWIGEQFYKTPEHFAVEADSQGISRRIKAIPRGFELGVTWVLLAHPKVSSTVVTVDCDNCGGSGAVKEFADGEDSAIVPVNCDRCKATGQVPKTEWQAGIFRVFKPERIEKLITQKQATPEEVQDLEKKGITPVIVPDDDKDHKGSVYDVEDEEPVVVH